MRRGNEVQRVTYESWHCVHAWDASRRYCGTQAFCLGDLWESFEWGPAYATLAWLTLPAAERGPLYEYTPPDVPEHSPMPSLVNAPPVTDDAPPRPLRVAIVSSHVYVVDVALLLRDLGASVSDWSAGSRAKPDRSRECTRVKDTC